MTQEEKAKRYDEALIKAKNIVNSINVGLIGKDSFEAVFPELKEESEDEKIRKELLQIVKENEDSFYMVMTPNKRERLIAWLEKQGMSISEDTKKKLEDNLNKALEKETPESWNKFLDGGEQKPADKVEPKFHEGEWLCENEPNNYARFIQILKIVNVQGKKRYRISRDIHNDEDIVEFNFVEKYYHKFDIKDAKDGDVLTYNGINNVWVCIFKEYTNERVYDYCTLDKENFWEYGNWNYLASFSYTPATKEQRDLLFAKMKESGYEWNAEKKELRKIINEKQIKKNLQDNSFRRMFEQNPANEPKFKVGDIVKHKDNPHLTYILKRFTDDGDYEFHAIGKDGNEGCTCFVVVKYQDEWELVKQNPAWSEEDEKEVAVLEAYIRSKDWSERHIDRALGIVDELVNKVKSLRPQNRWKPSDEQMKALWDSIKHNLHLHPVLKSLHNDLKKLREE